MWVTSANGNAANLPQAGVNQQAHLKTPIKHDALLCPAAGYDVWFGNVRGNHYSRNHTKWDILNPLFWAFSWDEIAAADLPAMVEYELAATGHSKVSYIGHSQGTTIMMAALSSNPGFAALIQVAILLAPVTFVTHVDSVPLVTLAKLNTDEVRHTPHIAMGPMVDCLLLVRCGACRVVILGTNSCAQQLLPLQ